MSTPFANPVEATVEAERLWREIGGQVREACILRRQGRHQAAATILEQGLPALIRSWAAESSLATAEAKAQLNRLFQDEQARVESHWIMARFIADGQPHDSAVRQLAAFPGAPMAAPADRPCFTGAAPSARAMVFPAIAPRRIPIEDVVDMIDAARDLERATARTA